MKYMISNYQDKPYINSLKSYLLRKTENKAQLLAALQDSNKKIGIVLQERLVNMPAQVVPPLFRIFDEELKATVSTHGRSVHS